MTTRLSRLLLATMLAGVGLGSASTAAFSAFPERPIRWILSHPPGGSADVIARLMQPSWRSSSASRSSSRTAPARAA